MRRAVRLFFTPFASSRLRAHNAQPDAAMRREEHLVHGERIAIYVWGDPAAQPYALLIHGWSSFGLRYLPWVEGLRAQGLAVVAFDQPGHGFSGGKLCSLPDFVATVRALGRHYGDAAAAIAHSLGGAALALAQDERWHAARQVLIAPAEDIDAATDRFFRFVGLGPHLRERFVRGFEQQSGVRVRDLSVSPRLAQMRATALIVHDRDDNDVPWHEGERYARQWPRARLLTTEGLGHHEVLHAPSVIAAGLAFLRGETIGERIPPLDSQRQ